jgi:hypothetical protein
MRPASAVAPCLKLRIERAWDEVLFQTTSLRPAYGAAVLLTWTSEPPTVESGVPPPVIDTVSRVATSLGRVAFRLFHPADPGLGIALLCASRPALSARIRAWITGVRLPDVAVAHQPTAAAQLFAQNWQLQGQLALVLRDRGISDETLRRLGRAKDWSGAGLPYDGRLLIAPAVDGAGILLAAASAAEVDHALGLLLQAFDETGIAWAGDAPDLAMTDMDVTVSHHIDASEPDADGMHEYHYEYDIHEFSRAGRTYVARSYVDEPQSVAFLSVREGGTSQLLRSSDLTHPLLVAAVDHLRSAGKTRVDRLSDPEGYVPLEVPLPPQR